jgi:hypothetical protein
MNLKENIVEHFDFEAVSPCVWKYLYSWYSADWCIMRNLKRDKTNLHGVYLELYPEATIPGQIIIDQTEEEVSMDPGILSGLGGTFQKTKTIEENLSNHRSIDKQVQSANVLKFLMADK